MTETPHAASEVVGVEELEGSLRVRLRKGSEPTFDATGHAIILIDPSSLKRHLTPTAQQDDTDDSWNPWRQGP